MNQSLVKASICSLLGMTQFAFAQSGFQPGDIERQVEQQRLAPLPPVEQKPGRISKPSELTPGAPSTLIRDWVLEGNTVLSTEELKAQLANFSGISMSMRQINEAAATIQQLYEEKGWLARIVVPKQDISDGVVRIQIIESRLGQIRIDSTSTSLVDMGLVQDMVTSQQSTGEILNPLKINRGLLLADDLNGVSVIGALQSGAQEGTTDVVLKTTAEQPYIYEATADNTNARSVGENRLLVSATMISPLGRGENLSIQGLKSEGIDYARLGAGFPLGNSGLKGSLFVTVMKYKVVTNDEQGRAQDIAGNVQTTGADLTYPLRRSRDANLYLQGSIEAKKFRGYAQGQVNSDYHINVASIGLTGNHFDTFAGAGTNSYSLIYSQGVVTSDGVQVNNTVAGSYSKVRWLYTRQQALASSLNFYAGLQGQNTGGKLLDSSENMSLGGVSGVRAYPAGEGVGPQGRILNLELRWSLTPEWTITPFIDWGHIEKREQSPKNYDLKGAGIGATWTAQSGWIAKAIYAQRIGSNPNPTVNGNDQDGSLRKQRVWFSLSRTF